MDPASLAVGIVGIAGLFTSILEVVDRVHTYRSFSADFEALNVRLRADRVRLEQWGQHVGLNTTETSAKHPALSNPNIFPVVESLLRILARITQADDTKRNELADEMLGAGYARPAYNAPSESKRTRMRWAIRGKSEWREQVKLFGAVVQKLHDIVPLGLTKALSEVSVTDTSITKGSQSTLSLQQNLLSESNVSRHDHRRARTR